MFVVRRHGFDYSRATGVCIRQNERHDAGRRTMENMAQVHMTEAELARDLHGVLEKVRQGAEVVI